MTIDRLWSDRGRPKISVIKVDVEGAEMGVLRGAIACISTTRPAIVLEWWPDNYSVYGENASAILNFSQKNNYRIFEITSQAEIDDEFKLRVSHRFGRDNFILIPVEYNDRD